MHQKAKIFRCVLRGTRTHTWLGIACTLLIVGMRPNLALGQLSWEGQEQPVVVELAEEQDVVETRFRLVNSGAYPLTIVSIEDDSRQATAGLAAGSVTVSPGQVREIDLKWTKPGRFFHPAKVTITADTDERGVEPLRLSLEIRPHGWTEMLEKHEALQKHLSDIPPPIVIEPQRLVWAVGGDPAPQTVEIRATGAPLEKDLNLVEGLFPQDSNGYETALEVLEEGVKYRLTVTPKSTDRPNMARLEFETHLEGDAALAWPSHRLRVITIVRPERNNADLDETEVSVTPSSVSP